MLTADKHPHVGTVRGVSHTHHPKGRNRLGLSLQHERAGRLDVDRGVNERTRRLADEHLSRLRRLLQPRRHVDGIACGEMFLHTCYDLARHDTDPSLQPELG